MQADRPPPPAPGPLGRVEVAGLTWRPVGRREPVLRDLSLTIPAGQRVLLVGPSGAGKSTLLRAFAGLLETADSGDRSGSVTIDGAVAGSVPGMVGMVLQEPGAGVVAATVGRDVAFGLENVGMPRDLMPSRVAAAVAAVRLDKELDTPTGTLSGGQTQRLAIAGALALGPSVLLLDEPTAMLDPANAATVRRTVAEVAASLGMTTVVVEHVLGPWLEHVDRLLVLGADGTVTADGDPASVLAHHGGRLAAEGVWVPGVPLPEPAVVPFGVFAALSPLADPDTVPGCVAVAAEHVRVERPVRTLTGETRTVVALDDATAYGRVGELTALVGPSGSGKSTLLLALGGLVEHQAGKATRTDLSSRDLAELLAWVPQWSSSTIVAPTVLDEVLLTSRGLGRDEASSRERAQALLDVLGLARLADADPRHLSGGEQRRLAVAAALLHQPTALLADEPTVGQDRLTWAAIVGVVQAYRAAGGAVVTSTHDESVIGRAHDVVRLTAPPQPAAPPVPRRPLVARCGPMSLLLGALGGIPAGVLSPGWRWSFVALAAQVGLALLGLSAPRSRSGPGPDARAPTGRARRVAARMLPGVFGAASVAWSTWLLGGHDLALAGTGALRVLLIVLPSAVLVPFVDPDALGDHLAQLLRLPARPVVAVSAALQRVHTFGAVWGEIRNARRVRGIAGGRGPAALVRALSAVTLGLLVRSLGAAAALAVAMDARGFATAQRRTWYAAAHWRLPDTLLVAAACLPVLLVTLAR